MRRQSHPKTTAADAGYGLSVLFVVALFNHLDRSIVSILQEPLKEDLGLSDLQLGLLTGLSFAVLYATLAVPMGRVADRVRRTWLMALALVLWSSMTALCGLASGFLSLVVLRMGVALGEACCTPTSMSLISDYYPARHRGLAIAFWSIAVPVGAVIGFVSGGWISDAVSWRAAFVWVGLAGVAFAPLVLTMREPPRGQFDDTPPLQSRGRHVSASEAFAVLWGFRSIRFLIVAGALQSFVLCATQNWSAPFYARVHDLDMSQVVQFLVVLFGLGGGIGALLGGGIVDRLGGTDARWYAWVPGLAAFMTIPLGLVQFLASAPLLSLGMGFMTVICTTLFMAPLNAATQSLVPSNMRGFTSACVLVVTNIIGLGLGPLAVGALSDQLIQIGFADLSLRYALSASLGVSLLAGCSYLVAARFLASEWPRASMPQEFELPVQATAINSR